MSRDVHRVVTADDAGVRDVFATGDRALADAWAGMLRARGHECAVVVPATAAVHPDDDRAAHDGIR